MRDRRLPMLDSDLPDADRMPCMLLFVTPDGVVLQSNRAFCEFVGEPVEGVCGATWLAQLADDSRLELARLLSLHSDFELCLRAPIASMAPGIDGWIDCSARWLAERGHYLCVLNDVTANKLAELSAQMRAEQFQLLADNVPVLIAYFDVKNLHCLFANRLYAQTFGWDETAVLGLTVAEIIGEAATQIIQPYIDEVLRDKRPVSYERERPLPTGGSQWLEVNLIPHFDGDGEIQGAFVLIHDISRHRRAERALRESEDRLAKFMQASAEGIVFHRDGRVLDANPPLCTLMGYSLDELLGRGTLEFIPLDEQPKALAVMTSGKEVAYETVLLHKDGRRLPVELIVRTMAYHGEQMRMTIVRDIRDRHAAQARIHYLAHHDALTGLPNRMSLMERLDHLMVAARREDAQLALLFIDIDHFKRVNDSLGHLAGDALLQTLSLRITEALRTTDVVARFGGDEFVVLLPRTLQRMDVEEVSQKLLSAIEQPFALDGRLMSVTPSIGIAVFPHDGQTADELIKNADTAMYAAKSRGRANHQFFSAHMAHSAYAALVLEGQLTQALERGEFVLHYQPQVRARDGVLVGVEALIRWNHPERGLLMPDTFIPLAEQQRLMLPIGQWVLREAARCAKRWQAVGGPAVPVAVNLSTMQFQTSGFTALIEQMLREEEVDGSLIELELTERMLMDDLPEVKRKLHELKALGLRISVDDFGTGYSSLAHLKELPIDKMKIDRSFVHDLPERQDSAAITQAIVQMARALGLGVIAEGVETQAQSDFLAGLGCDELQGLWVGRPMAAAQLEAWVAARSAAPVLPG